jgi:hypothetical protein
MVWINGLEQWFGVMAGAIDGSVATIARDHNSRVIAAFRTLGRAKGINGPPSVQGLRRRFLNLHIECQPPTCRKGITVFPVKVRTNRAFLDRGATKRSLRLPSERPVFASF